MRDALRILVLIEASVALWLAMVVWWRYWRRYRDAVKSGTGGRRKHVPGRRGAELPWRADTDWIGLIPAHVVLVSAFAVFSITQSVALVAVHVGRGIVWYGIPLSLAKLTALIAGLLTVAAYENRVSGRR